jgi:hypothetical protein
MCTSITPAVTHEITLLTRAPPPQRPPLLCSLGAPLSLCVRVQYLFDDTLKERLQKLALSIGAQVSYPPLYCLSTEAYRLVSHIAPGRFWILCS